MVHNVTRYTIPDGTHNQWYTMLHGTQYPMEHITNGTQCYTVHNTRWNTIAKVTLPNGTIYPIQCNGHTIFKGINPTTQYTTQVILFPMVHPGFSKLHLLLYAPSVH